MWPVFVEQFNSEFLINDTGEVQLITSFLRFYWAILSIIGFIKKLLITALRINLEIMWPVFVVQFNCEFLRNDGGDVQLIFLFLNWFWAVLCVLWCVGKLRIAPFRTVLYLVNVASIRLTIQFRVFEQWCRRCGTSNYFISRPILYHYLCSWVR